MIEKAKNTFPFVVLLIPILWMIWRGSILGASGSLVVLYEGIIFFSSLVISFLLVFLVVDKELTTKQKVFYLFTCIVCAVIFYMFNGHLFIQSLFT